MSAYAVVNTQRDRRLLNFLNFETGHIARRPLLSLTRSPPHKIVHAFIEERDQFPDARGCLALIFKCLPSDLDRYYVVHLKKHKISLHQADLIADVAMDSNKTIWLMCESRTNADGEQLFETFFSITNCIVN